MRLRVVAAFVLVVAGAAAWNYLRPIPTGSWVVAVPASEVVAGAVPSLPWPGQGSAALAVSGLGFLASSGNEQPLPAASVTKVMTALIILEDRPLAKGADGPTITIGAADVQSYLADAADRESVVYVQAGEQLTEFQLLEGLLIPSANNFSQTLARWDLGSVAAFVARMNAKAAALGLKHTSFADTSGASPQSVSTPSDLVALGMVAMEQEVFAQIVAMEQAVLPVVGTVYNVDRVIGQSGIVGIKTGSGLSSGANFLFAANLSVDGHSITVFGCVMGQETLDAAFAGAVALVNVVQPALHVRRVLAQNDVIASIGTPWGAQTDAVASIEVDLVEWPGLVLHQKVDTLPIVVEQPISPGTKEGIEHIELGDYNLDVPIVTASGLYPPGRLWRLLRVSL